MQIVKKTFNQGMIAVADLFLNRSQWFLMDSIDLGALYTYGLKVKTFMEFSDLDNSLRLYLSGQLL